MVIVYCGDLWAGSTSRMRMEALERVGHAVVAVDTSYSPQGLKGLISRVVRKAGWAMDAVNANDALLAAVAGHKPDVVWIDKGLSIEAGT